jgi:hypothetical protein
MRRPERRPDPADDTRASPRKPIVPSAWVLSGATGAAVVALAVMRLVAGGESQFFSTGDPRLFLLTTRDLFGTGHGYAALGFASEIPYRYGRMGLPLLAWLFAFGRPALVAWTLIGINLGALTAIPGLASVLLDEYGAPPQAAAFILVLPAFVVLYGNVFSDPLLIVLLLLAFLLDARHHHGTALALLAYAVLVKEIAVLALFPMLWRAVRRHKWRDAGIVTSAVAPYAAWCIWLRWRVGEFPFFAQTQARKGALGLPFVAFHHTMAHPSGHDTVLLATVMATIVLGIAGAWFARGTQIGGLAAVYTIVSVSLGSEPLRLFGEGLRVLLLAQVFGVLALAVGLRARPSSRRTGSPAPEPALGRLACRSGDGESGSAGGR